MRPAAAAINIVIFNIEDFFGNFDSNQNCCKKLAGDFYAAMQHADFSKLLIL